MFIELISELDPQENKLWTFIVLVWLVSKLVHQKDGLLVLI